MKLRLLTLIICIVAMYTTAHAAPVATVSCESGTTYINGEISLGELEEPAAVTVTVRDSEGNLNYADIIMADTDGVAKFRYNNLGNSGNYTCYFYVPTLNITRPVQITGFIGQDYWIGFVNDISDCCKENKPISVKERFIAEIDRLSVDMTDYDSLTDQDLVFEVMVENYTGFNETQDILDAFKVAVRLCSYNENKSTDSLKSLYKEEAADDYFGILDKLPDSEGDGISIIDDLSDSLQNAVFGSIAEKTYKSSEDLSDAFVNQTALQTVKHADNYGEVKKVLKAYQNAGLLDLTQNGKRKMEDVCKSIIGNSYSSLEALEDDYNSIASKSQQSRKPSGGGGGGGGISVAGNKITVVNDAVPTPAPIEDNPGLLSGKMYFDDMEDAKWALSAVNNLYENKIIDGTGEKTFSPHRDVSRCEMTKLIVNTAGMEIVNYGADFNDVDKTQWYYPFVATACANGVFKGYENGSFNTHGSITRQEAALVIYRLVKPYAGDVIETDFKFADDGEIAEWSREAVYYLKNADIMKGRSDDEFRPHETLTRVEAAVLCDKVYKYVKEVNEA